MSAPMRLAFAVAAAALLLAALAAPPASAASVRLISISIEDDDEFDREDDSDQYSVIRYEAAPGERNRLVVRAVRGGLVRFSDAGARVRPGRGCRSTTRHTVVCRQGIDLRLIRVVLGGRPDRLSVSSRLRFPIEASGGGGADRLSAGRGTSSLSGGPGDDRLTGGRGADTLDGEAGRDRIVGRDGADELLGGSGRDRLYGGDGNDVLVATDRAASGEPDRLSGGGGSDRASYVGRTSGVIASTRGGGLEGEGDRFATIEGVTGGRGPDVLTGDDGVNRMAGGGGHDRIDGRGGDDRIDVDYNVSAGDSTDVACGDGADRVVVYASFAEHVLLRGDCERLLNSYGTEGLDPRPSPVTGDTLRIALPCAASHVSEENRAVVLRTPPSGFPWFPAGPSKEDVARGVRPRGPDGSSCPTTFVLTDRGRELLAALGELPVTVPSTALGVFGVLLRRA